MIIGIGTDIVEISRIERLLERYGDTFLTRTFTPSEIEDIRAKPHMAPACAKRFAAKEAYAKARGTGFSSGFTLKDVFVVHDDSGKPQLRFSDAEQARTGGLNVQLSLSDEASHALAFVVVERV